MSGWRPSLRIARRTVRRSLGRSLLVATLVGLPVMGATFVDVLYRSTQATPAQQAEQSLGAADASVSVYDFAPLDPAFRPQPNSGWGEPKDATHRDGASVDVADLLPTGSTVLDAPQSAPVKLRSAERTVRSDAEVVDLSSPLTQRLVRLRTGSFPTAADVADGTLLTRPLAQRLHLLDGDSLVRGATVTLTDGTQTRVIGVVVQPRCLHCEAMYVHPRSAVGSALIAGGHTYGASGEGAGYLVDLPAATDVDALWRRLAPQGVALVPREAYLHPQRYETTQSNVSVSELQGVAIVALIVGLGLLEVVLLAGTAFAVGARRQVRDLGLVAVTGGTAKDVRRVVLAQGLVLGGIGAVGGIVLGAGVTVALKPLWENVGGQLIESWRFGPLEILVAACVGLFSGLAAAVLPAVGAGRMKPIDALHRRFRVRRGASVGVPVVGVALIAVGAVVSVYGSQLMSDDFDAYKRKLATVQQTGAYINAPAPTVPVALILLGLVIAVAGIVTTIPTVVGLLGRLGGLLTLSPRLALRDASRHRHRTGPATSAIAIAVAGSVGIGVMVHNLEIGERLRHVPQLPANVVQVQSNGNGSLDVMTADVPRGEQAVLRLVPGSAAVESFTPLLPVRPAQPGEPKPPAEAEYWTRQATLNITCAPADAAGPDGCVFNGSQTMLRAGGPDLLALVLGRAPSSAELVTLERGGVVVTDPQTVNDGKAQVADPSASEGTLRSLPALLAPRRQAYSALPSAVMSVDAARAMGWDLVRGESLVKVPALPVGDALDRLKDATDQADTYLAYEQRFRSDYRAAQLILLAAGAFVTFVGVAIAVALSAAESRADLSTLAAVGAQPSRRRRLSAAQALLVGGLGCLVGLGLGMFAAYVARAGTGAPSFSMPWSTVAATGVVVPLLASLVAWLVTPGRLPMVRRIE